VNTDKSSTHGHRVGTKPTTNTGVHSHTLSAVDARLAALEAAMANVVLRITKLEGTDAPPLPPPVPPPIEPTPGTGVHRYISPSGSDAADGRIDSPWRTIAQFLTVAKKGDTLECRGGTYGSHPAAVAGYAGKPGLLGTSAEPITIRAYPGETPIFSGGNGPLIGIAGAVSPSAYVVIDGIQCTDRLIGSSGAIYVGAWASADPTQYNAEHVTIRNFKFTMKYGDVLNQSHGVYASRCARYVTVEDSLFIGPGSGGAGGDGVTLGASSGLNPDELIVQRCIFTNFNQGGISVWDETATHANMTALISHCSFVDNLNLGAMRIEKHGPTTVIDCASTGIYVAPTSGNGNPWIYHAYEAITDVTQTNNYFEQEFDANYFLLAGQTGKNAGTDGKDAGALDD